MKTLSRSLACSSVIALVAVATATGAAAEQANTPERHSWISLSGSVQEVRPNAFTLDYGGGLITVETGDRSQGAKAYGLVEGDRVTVTGVIDDAFFEATTIDAGSLYVERLATYFSGSTGRRDVGFVSIATPVVPGNTLLQGTVAEITGEREFVVQADTRRVTVETHVLAADPLGDDGRMDLEVGDIVRVTGDIDYNFVERRELVASSITKIAE